VLASIVPAIALGYVLARKPFPGRWLVELVVNLPLVLPPVVTGYLLLIWFGTQGTVGAFLERWFGLRFAFTWLGAALAAAVVSFPLMVRTVRLAFQGVDPRFELAARSLGAHPIRAFLTVALPLASRGVVAGAVLGFARSLGEFGATVMIAGNTAGQTRTIPLAIYSLSNRPGGIEQSWRLVGLSITLACLALTLSEWLERRQTRHELA
jgi:molybdate transport system permease protein